jgi:hypothetical protein
VPELVEHRKHGRARDPHNVFLIWHRQFVCLGYSVTPDLEVTDVDRLLDPRAVPGGAAGQSNGLVHGDRVLSSQSLADTRSTSQKPTGWR